MQVELLFPITILGKLALIKDNPKPGHESATIFISSGRISLLMPSLFIDPLGIDM